MLRRKKSRSKTNPRGTQSLSAGLRRVEQKQWWLSFSGVLVTLLLTAGIISLSLTMYILQRPLWDALNIHLAMRGLVGMVFLFIVYVVYQQVQIYRFRLRVMAQEELFGLIGENAADCSAILPKNWKKLPRTSKSIPTTNRQ
jgi:sterol desaturase/sphingolipid hydroxylase (fatty acid hydroxylase superfamily)